MELLVSSPGLGTCGSVNAFFYYYHKKVNRIWYCIEDQFCIYCALPFIVHNQNIIKKISMYISFVIWMVPPTSPLLLTPTLALMSCGESVSVATTAPVHKWPAFPWARVEVPEQNIFWTSPLWHWLQAAVCCWNCMWGEKKNRLKTYPTNWDAADVLYFTIF